MRKVSFFDLRKNQNIGRRWGACFMVKTPRNPWSFGELYGRSMRWAGSFRSRRSGSRIEAAQQRLRNKLLDCQRQSRVAGLNESDMR